MPNPVTRIAQTVAPERLGRNFRWVLAAVTVMNLGDGVVVAAGPLLVASQTRDPFLVSLAVFAEYLPTLVVGTLAGVIADRVDRKRLTVVMNLGRSVALVILAWTILSGEVSIGLILVMLLVLGTAETFADLGSTSLLPSLVPRSEPGPRQRPDPGLDPPDEPAHRTADRRLPVRRGNGHPVRGRRGRLRAGCRAAVADRHARRARWMSVRTVP